MKSLIILCTKNRKIKTSFEMDMNSQRNITNNKRKLGDISPLFKGQTNQGKVTNKGKSCIRVSESMTLLLIENLSSMKYIGRSSRVEEYSWIVLIGKLSFCGSFVFV